jgi:hypothetical protein
VRRLGYEKARFDAGFLYVTVLLLLLETRHWYR